MLQLCYDQNYCSVLSGPSDIRERASPACPSHCQLKFEMILILSRNKRVQAIFTYNELQSCSRFKKERETLVERVPGA